MATGISTAKLILCGEHAVVYGEPAISLPFTQAIVKTDVSEIAGDTLFKSTFYTGILHNMLEFLAGIKQLIIDVLTEISNSSASIAIHVMSEVPIGRGLGSSAAVSASITKALYRYFNVSLTNEKLLELVNRSEKLAHGNPSGVDAITVVSGKPVWFERGKKLELIQFHKKIYIIVADTGIPSETKSAVEDVSHLLETNPAIYKNYIHELGDITRKIRYQFENDGNIKAIGQAMNSAQILLEKLTVSAPTLEKLIKAALANGAFGAKLTGGGRGGCMIAIAESHAQAEIIQVALKNAGAAHAWIFTIGEDEN